MGKTKTAPLDDDTHALLKKIQSTIYERWGIDMNIQQVIAYTVPDHDAAIKIVAEKITKKTRMANDIPDN